MKPSARIRDRIGPRTRRMEARAVAIVAAGLVAANAVFGVAVAIALQAEAEHAAFDAAVRPGMALARAEAPEGPAPALAAASAVPGAQAAVQAGAEAGPWAGAGAQAPEERRSPVALVFDSPQEAMAAGAMVFALSGFASVLVMRLSRGEQQRPAPQRSGAPRSADHEPRQP